MDHSVFERLGVALGLGLIVGLQRQWTRSEIAGIRTFPLITILGALLAELDGRQPGVLSAVGLLAIASLILAANLLRKQLATVDPGMTTEVAALLMYATGLACGCGMLTPSIAVSGVVVVLLHWKATLHSLVERIGERDIRAIMNLALIAMVILPILPDQTYGWYDVLNPWRIWMMVVLIVGISLVAYLARRILGARAGGLVGGLLGGLISSTATTVSFARRSREVPLTVATSTLVIMLASAAVNARVLFEIGVVAPALLRVAIGPLGSLLIVMGALSLIPFFSSRQYVEDGSDYDNPAQLQVAIGFGVLYATVLLTVAAVRTHFGDRALYAVAVLSGLTDLDAITLSTAELVQSQRLDSVLGLRVILLAIMSNLVFKLGVVALLGSRRLLIAVSLLFGISLAVGACVLIFWPIGRP